MSTLPMYVWVIVLVGLIGTIRGDLCHAVAPASHPPAAAAPPAPPTPKSPP